MTLHVEVSGQGPDVVLLHGWGMCSRIWGHMRDLLAARYRVHAVDLPGHGMSKCPMPSSVAACVDDLAARLPKSVRLVGWSLGGQIALALAAALPRRVAWLALFATTPCFVARSDWEHGMPEPEFRTFSDGVTQDRAAVLARFTSLMTLGGVRARATTQWLRDRLAEVPVPSVHALDSGLALLRELDLRERLTDIGAAAVVVHGTADRIVPHEAGRILAQKLRRARFVSLEGAGHAPFLSHPQAIADAIGELDDER